MNLENLIKKANLSEAEIRALLRQKTHQKFSGSYKVGTDKVKYAAISDTHIGNKSFDPEFMDFAIKTINKEKVDFVTHAGDICDGLYTSRPGHVFELDDIGGDVQVKHASEILSQFKAPLYFITGNHCHNTFFKNAGFDIGKQIAEKVKGSEYLGNGEGFIDLKYGHKIELMHPDGGTAYALSYRPQKIVESLEGGTKPKILHIGHFHKANYMYYRNIHVFQDGTMCRQTPFMRGKNIPAHVGFWIIDASFDRKGISDISPKFYPGY
ncbi:MAG: hypothetical protein D4S01_08880 [Dehalococcoidia bacterium]|nr:MAG: hypothetical protein D4S01_08880 [Dehalococcoidia bacterium]